MLVHARSSPEFLSSHVLDDKDCGTIRSSEGQAAGAFAIGTAELWNILRHVDGAFALVVKDGERVGVASSTTMIEGRLGLNIGMYMAQLRDLPRPQLPTAPDPIRFAQRYRHVLWALVERLGRVEAHRLYELRIGEDRVRLDVTRDGFAFVAGCDAPEAFCQALREACDREEGVAYTLADEEDSSTAARYHVSDLFARNELEPLQLSIDSEGWPTAVPPGIRLSTLRIVAAASQRFFSHDALRHASLTLIDERSAKVLSANRDDACAVFKLATTSAIHD